MICVYQQIAVVKTEVKYGQIMQILPQATNFL